MKKYSDSEILAATKEAPAPVREIVEDVQTAFTIAEIGQRYNFHIDQIGLLAELNRNMLLGLVNPQEFLQELLVAKIPDADAKQIMTEINQKIFVPLRNEMRKEGISASVAKPAEAAAPSAAPRASVPVPSGTPPRYFHLQNKLPSTGAAQSPTQPEPPREGSQTSFNPQRRLEDHEEPHIEFSKPPAPPPANLPGAIQPPDTPNKVEPPVQPARPRPATSVTPYSTDPYREPIE